MIIIGQKKLLQTVNTYNFNNFPRTSLFIGEFGSGRHFIINYLKENILNNINIKDISDSISDELIDEIYRNPIPMIYLIDLSKMTEKESNIILKFIEEPLNNSFIVLLAESRIGVLNTVLNRCMIFEMDKYSKEELLEFNKEFDSNSFVFEIAGTPGKLINFTKNEFNNICSLCETIVDKLEIASYPNTLSILDKLNFKDEYDKIDIDWFFKILLYYSKNKYFSNLSNLKYYKYYEYINQSYNKLSDKRFNRQVFMTNFLSNLWRISRCR